MYQNTMLLLYKHYFGQSQNLFMHASVICTKIQCYYSININLVSLKIYLQTPQ